MKKIIFALFLLLSLNVLSQKITLQATSATSGTVTAQDTQQDLILVHDAGATLSLTVKFPANPVSGQLFCFSTVSGITTLGLNSVFTIVGNVVSLATGGTGTWCYDGTKWIRIR